MFKVLRQPRREFLTPAGSKVSRSFHRGGTPSWVRQMHRSLSDGQGGGEGHPEHAQSTGVWNHVCMGLGVKCKVGVLPVRPAMGVICLWLPLSPVFPTLQPHWSPCCSSKNPSMLLLWEGPSFYTILPSRFHGSTLISFQSWPGIILSERPFLTTLSKVAIQLLILLIFFCLALTLGVYRVFVYCVSPTMKSKLPDDWGFECLQQCLA